MSDHAFDLGPAADPAMKPIVPRQRNYGHGGVCFTVKACGNPSRCASGFRPGRSRHSSRRARRPWMPDDLPRPSACWRPWSAGSHASNRTPASRQKRIFTPNAAMNKHTAWPTARRAATETARQRMTRRVLGNRALTRFGRSRRERRYVAGSAAAPDHEVRGGLAGGPVAVAGPGSCWLRNGITREATRSGSSSITQWP
jgi:hypothetical protein